MVQAISVNSDYQITIRGDFGIVHMSIRPNGQVIGYNELTKEVYVSKKSLRAYVLAVVKARRTGTEADMASESRRLFRALQQTNDSTFTDSLEHFLAYVSSREVENIRLGAFVGGKSDADYRKLINDHAKAEANVQRNANRSPENSINDTTGVVPTTTIDGLVMKGGSNVTPTEAEMLKLLTQGVVALVFKKVDGSRREMLATLNRDIIAQVSPADAEDLVLLHKSNTLSVFDLGANAFRKFKSPAVFPITSPLVEEFAEVVPENKAFRGVSFVALPSSTPWIKFSTKEYTFMDFVNACFPRANAPQSTSTNVRGVNLEGLTPVVLKEAHARYIIEVMKTNAINIRFEKRDESIREMLATRNLALLPAFNDVKEGISPTFADMSSISGTEHYLERNRVAVLDMDKNAKREFNIERLIGYTKPDGEYVDVARQIAEAQEMVNRRVEQATDTSANEVYSIEQMLQILGDNVVRAVVSTSTSDYRVMFATRNQSIINMHEKIGTATAESTSTKSAEERRAEMVEKRQINVFDVSKQGWITLAVDKLHKIDAIENVPSWVEFDVDAGDWFAVMQGRVSAQDGYTGVDFKGRDMTAIDKERLMFESRQFRYHTLKQTMDLDNSWKVQLQVANQLKDRALATVTNYTSQDIETLEVLREFAYALQRGWQEGLDNKTEDATMVFTDIKESAKDKLITVRFNWGRDVIFLHPRFIVNAQSHKVYADRTEVFKFPSRALSHNVLDVKLQVALEKVASLVTARRKADILTKELAEVDTRRLRRLHQVIKQQKAALEQEGIKFGGTKAYPTQIKVKVNNKGFLAISPEYIIDEQRKQFMFVRTPETTYVSEVEPKVQPNAANPLGKVLAVYMQACDLRRTVLDDNGNPM